MLRRIVPFLLMPLSLALVAGCTGSKVGTVSGKVAYKNEPVTGGKMKLYPQGGGPEYPINLNPDGTFNVGDVPPGTYAVAIDTDSLKNQADPTAVYKQPVPKGADPSKVNKVEVDTTNLPKYVKIPPKYKDPKTSGLTWEIKKGKNSPKEFDLTD
jgi:hypothetical protein